MRESYLDNDADTFFELFLILGNFETLKTLSTYYSYPNEFLLD